MIVPFQHRRRPAPMSHRTSQPPPKARPYRDPPRLPLALAELRKGSYWIWAYCRGG
jgi:hypothetical protein